MVLTFKKKTKKKKITKIIYNCKSRKQNLIQNINKNYSSISVYQWN